MKSPEMLLRFNQTIDLILANKKITKKSWGDPTIYGYMDMSRLKLHMENKDFDWILSKEDMEGEDYYELV